MSANGDVLVELDGQQYFTIQNDSLTRYSASRRVITPSKSRARRLQARLDFVCRSLPMAGMMRFPMLVLPAGTTVFHGTDSAGEFLIPDGPAWFAFDQAKAKQWAGWSQGMPAGRTKADRRVLVLRTTADVSLLDTRKVRDWEKLCLDLCGDPEAGMYVVAQEVRQAGYAGWYGRTEMLLGNPAAWLASEAVLELEPKPPAGAAL